MTLPGLTPAPPLECLYTNDARRVAAWLAEHVPAEPCVLGFDVEVGNCSYKERFTSHEDDTG